MLTKQEIMAKHGLSETKFEQMTTRLMNVELSEALDYPKGSPERDVASLVMTSAVVGPEITITISGPQSIGKSVLAEQLQLVLTAMGHNARNDDGGVTQEFPSFGNIPTPIQRRLILIETRDS